MKLKKRIMDSKLGALKKVLGEFILEGKMWLKYAYDSNMSKDNTKMQIDLIIRAHALEKGMSIGKVKEGFGKEKVKTLICDLQRFVELGGAKSTVNEICGIISQYMIFNGFVGSGNEVEHLFTTFCNNNGIIIDNNNKLGGIDIKELLKSKETCGFDFAEFAYSRYSIRDYSDVPIEKEKVNQALKICEKTPSACNRQPWRVYVYYNKPQRDSIFKAQNGVIGFEDEMQCAILICCDARCYNTGESNLPYIDGGLYGMNLLYALHHVGLAAIPLSVSYHKRRMKEIKVAAGIKEYELPVLLIGVGTFKDSYKVAVSHRKLYQEYTNFK